MFIDFPLNFVFFGGTEFCIDLIVFWGTFLFPRGRQNAPIFSEMKTPSRFAQSGHPRKSLCAPGLAQRRYRGAKVAPFWATWSQLAFRVPPGALPVTILVDFGMDF